MSNKSQEGDETQEPKNVKSFENEFFRISDETVLRQYEEKNRDKIIKTVDVWPAWTQKWKKLTGGDYFQPATAVTPSPPLHGKNITERSDPKSREYRELLTFTKIRWRRIRRKIGKKMQDLFILDGVPKGGKERPIYQNLTYGRLEELLGTKTRDKIREDCRKNSLDHGVIEGSFEILAEGYWEVIFAPQKDPNDTLDVRLTWEGQCLRIQRQVPVVLPGFYLEIADNAMRAHYIQNPEQGRKIASWIQEYPYTTTRPATMEEYLAQKKVGDKIMKDAMRREESNV